MLKYVTEAGYISLKSDLLTFVIGFWKVTSETAKQNKLNF